MSRIGLQQLSSSARNSPFGTEKLLLEKSSSSSKGHPEPLKLAALKKYQPVTPSPLAKNIAPVSSPFSVFCEESKENVETQTLELHSTSTQTTISVPHIQPKITEEDLTADKPTVNYLRVTADRLQMDLDDELVRNTKLVNEMCDLDEKMRKIDEDMEILLDVLADIEKEQMDDEIGTAHI